MTSLIPRPTVFPELLRLLEGGWPFGEHHPVRIETFRDNGNFVLRAELPGLDPDKDIRVGVEGNELSIDAERTVEKHDKGHSEFSYGSFTRTVRLPVGAAADKVSASYKSGILEVTVPVVEPVEAKKIAIDVRKA
jgi:HSP20 family molecular chaperone IbpA